MPTGPTEASQLEGISHDQAGHPNQQIKGEDTWNRGIDQATGYASNGVNFDPAHAADADAPVKVEVPND